MTRKHVQKIAAVAAFSLLTALLVFQFGNLLFRGNLHTVIPGQVYRSAQPTPASLEHWIDSIGLRSLINLKGQSRSVATSYGYDQVADAAQVDVAYVRLSARRWPSPAEVERLITALDTAERPLLIHCQSGTDRSGLAAAIALLLEGRDLDRASEQFSLKFGYPGELLGSDLPGFLASYRDSLSSKGQSHTAEQFRAWVKADYIAYYYEVELEFDPLPQTLRAGEPFSLQVRVTNVSSQPIPMRCVGGEGVRLSVRLRSLEPGAGKPTERRFCNGSETLAPAATTVVSAGVYKLATPGSYEFAADLVDEFEEHFFADMGSRVTHQTITVH